MNSHGANSNISENTATQQLVDISTETSTTVDSVTVSTMESNPAPSYSFTVTTARKLTKLSKASKGNIFNNHHLPNMSILI